MSFHPCWHVVTYYYSNNYNKQHWRWLDEQIEENRSWMNKYKNKLIDEQTAGPARLTDCVWHGPRQWEQQGAQPRSLYSLPTQTGQQALREREKTAAAAAAFSAPLHCHSLFLNSCSLSLAASCISQLFLEPFPRRNSLRILLLLSGLMGVVGSVDRRDEERIGGRKHSGCWIRLCLSPSSSRSKVDDNALAGAAPARASGNGCFLSALVQNCSFLFCFDVFGITLVLLDIWCALHCCLLQVEKA